MSTVRSRRCGGSSRPASSPRSRASCATWASPRTWHRTRWWRRSNSGRRRACRTGRAPGSWPRRGTAPSITCGGCGMRSRKEDAGWGGDRGSGAAGSRAGGPTQRSTIRSANGVLLALAFTTCHPALSLEARVALTLRLLGGLTTAEVTRAFVVPEPTIAQRMVRTKRRAGGRHPRQLRRAARCGELVARLAGGARGGLPRLQRGLLRHGRRRLDAARALRGRAAAGARSGRADAARNRRCTGSWR